MTSTMRKFCGAWLWLLALGFGWQGVAWAKTNQTITFGTLSNRTYGSGSFTVSATTSSGLAVTFTSATTTICTVSGTNGTTVNLIAAGTCKIDANQAGNGTFNAATQVQQSFTINKASQTIAFNSLPNRTDAAQPFAIAATASSGLTVTFTSGTPGVCTVSGSTVTLTGTDGTCTIAADQAGNGNYAAAGEVTQSFTVGPFCVPPPNIPNTVTVTCVCDTFNRASINPSPMFGGTNWAVSYSDTTGVAPYINATTGLLRLTENTNYNAKAATAPGIYPAAGNYISVEFNHYAYNGSGADGVGVTLSDSSIPAVPGGYGGSQGYAPESTPGFAGGWLGVALDEYGNYSNPTEGRNLGPGATPEEVGMRGPGKGTLGYNWITGTSSSPGGLSIDAHTSTTPAPGYMYQVVVDARNETTGSINVSVNRDSTTYDGNNYSAIIAPYNVYSAAQTALSSGWTSTLVPNYWQISLTSSTGGSTNIHEIGDMRICAQTVYPPSGGQASGFSAIDSAYPTSTNAVPAYQNFQTGDIYMKLQGTPFKLWVAALTSNNISYAYSATTTKYVLLNLVQNTGGASCGLDTARTCNASSCSGSTAPVVANQILTYTPTTPGAQLTSNITLNSAYSDLVAVMKECTTSACTAFTSTAPACSVDSFSVRPTQVTTVTTPANNATATGTVAYPAGTGSLSKGITITATTAGVAGQPSLYNGSLHISNAALVPLIDSSSEANPWTPNKGSVSALSTNSTFITFPAATSGTGSATSVGVFSYSEVGSFMLPGYNPATDTTSTRGVYDGVISSVDCVNANGTSFTSTACDAVKSGTWTAVDSVSTKNDCDVDSFSNTIDANGKYGCNFGNIANTATIGRFTPDHYTLTASTITPRSDLASTCQSSLQTKDPLFVPFSYMSEPFNLSFTLQAQNGSGAVTQNYQGNYVKFSGITNPAAWTASSASSSSAAMGVAMTALNYTPPLGTSTCQVFFGTGGVTSYSCPSTTTPASTTNSSGSRVSVVSTPSAPSVSWGNSPTTLTPIPAIAAGNGIFSANAMLTRSSTGPDGPFNNLNIGIAPVDTDGVTVSQSALNLVTNTTQTAPTVDRVLFGSTPVKFGMMKMQNVYGAASQPLPIPVQIMYWNGTTFVVNAKNILNQTYDSCTTINGSNVADAFTGSLSACSSYIPVSTQVNSGTALVTLSAPNAAGSVTLTDLLTTTSTSGTSCSGTSPGTATGINAPYLQNNGGTGSTSTFTTNPSGRATFGVFSGNPAVIYTRESY